MEGPAGGPRRPQALQQHAVPEEAAVPDGQVDPSQILVHDAAGPDVEVADFGVALLARRETDRLAGGRQRGARPARPQAIPVRLARSGDGVAKGIRVVAPAVDHDQDQPWIRHAQTGEAVAAAAATMAVKASGFRLAPPTRAPSISGWAIKSAAFSAVTLPP